MAFFRKWKAHYKHKKFTSDDAVDGDVSNIDDMKLDLACSEADEDEEDNKSLYATYETKYLGCVPIETKRSEKTTSEAIKTVIANSKAGGRKNKTHKRVKLNISPDGLEVLEGQETLMKFSIYKISYCSVDAAHDHAFSFVGSEVDELTGQEKMSCHVFYCAKRKIAHEITLTVARCFESAYQSWRDTVVQHTKSQGMSLGDNMDPKQILKEQNGGGVHEARADVHQQQPDDHRVDNLLIDLAASDNDVRKYLQNAWVSFDDETREGVHIVAC